LASPATSSKSVPEAISTVKSAVVPEVAFAMTKELPPGMMPRIVTGGTALESQEICKLSHWLGVDVSVNRKNSGFEGEVLRHDESEDEAIDVTADVPPVPIPFASLSIATN